MFFRLALKGSHDITPPACSGAKIDAMSRTCRRTMVFLSGVALIAAFGARAGALPPQAGLLPQTDAHDPSKLDFQSALSHYNAGDYSRAAQELEALARQAPESFDVEELLGLVFSAEGKDAEALPRLEKAARLKPNSASARCNLAVNYSKLGKNDLAESAFRKAIALDPHNVDTNHDFGEFYVRAGKLPAAIPYLEEAQRQDPTSYENGYDLALAYALTGQWKPAQRLIEPLLEKKDTAELHNLLAEVDEGGGDYVAAANEYQRAAHMDPSESNLFDWGSELLLHHTIDPAVEVFTQGLNRYPGSARLAVGLGLALYWRSSYDDAVKALLKATDLAPADARAYYFLSKAYDMSPGQADEVIAHFARFAEREPRDARAAYYYGMSLWKGKRSEGSIALLNQVEALLKKASALDPSFADAHLQLGNLYSQERRYENAVPEYLEALRLDPNIPDAHYRLGQAYVHLGKKDLAEKEFHVHKELYEKHLADVDEQRTKIRQFIYSIKGDHSGT